MRVFSGFPGKAPDESTAFRLSEDGGAVVISDVVAPYLSFTVGVDGSVESVLHPMVHPTMSEHLQDHPGDSNRRQWMALPPVRSGGDRIQIFADIYSSRRIEVSYDSLNIPKRVRSHDDPIGLVATSIQWRTTASNTKVFTLGGDGVQAEIGARHGGVARSVIQCGGVP